MKPKFKADSFIYPAPNAVLKKIQCEVQKKMNKALNKESQERFVITAVLHSYFDFGYFDSTMDIKEISKAMYPHDMEKAEDLNNIVIEVLNEGIK